MVKSIIKEIFIMGLLFIAIGLLIGVLLYEYMPNKRDVPTKQAYYTPENIKTELGEKVTELEKTEISYEITDSDLTVYRQISSYKPGKADPFSLVESQPESADESGTTNSNNSKNNGSSSKSNNSTTQSTEENVQDIDTKKSTNTFWEDDSMK